MSPMIPNLLKIFSWLAENIETQSGYRVGELGWACGFMGESGGGGRGQGAGGRGQGVGEKKGWAEAISTTKPLVSFI